ncbi:hypothetical protein [Streptomyces sp. NPDC059918]
MLPKTPWLAGPRPAAATTPNPGPRARPEAVLPAGLTEAARP